LAGITQWDNPRAVSAANFIATLNNLENCEKCGTCENLCKFNAIHIVDEVPEIDIKKCMGCGICVVNCPGEVIKLKRLNREHIYTNEIELGLKILKDTNKKLS